MRLRAWVIPLLVLSACASSPAPPLSPRPLARGPTSPSGPDIRLVEAPMDPVQESARIGQADLEKARALWLWAREDLEPRQWEALERKLTAAEQAFERFSRAAKASGEAAEVVRGTEGLAQAGRARTLAKVLPRVGPLLMGLVLLYPSSTARPEIDHRPEWVDAQEEYEARLREVSEASRQLMGELETQPRVAKTPGREFAPREPSASALVEEDDPRCKPIPVPYHLGGNPLHNECADKVPNNSFPGGDVLVNGKNFDALQLATRTLWEVKTDDFDAHTLALRRFVIREQVVALLQEGDLAKACGFDFRIGVRRESHEDALERAEPRLEGLIIVMDWC